MNTAANTAADPANEKVAQFVWLGFILLFFVLQAILWTVAIMFTAGDRSHAVVAGYDQQAFKWDQVREAQIESQRLGWKANFDVSDTSDAIGNRIISLALSDKSGSPVEDVRLSIRVFHNGRAADVQMVNFSQTAAGKFTAAVNIDRSGYWQFDGTASLKDDVFLINEKLWIDKGE